jgi:hypothetical protein
MFNWPAKIPDLIPVKTIWTCIKKSLNGRHFHREDILFEAIQKEWNDTPDDLVDKLVSSFPVRLTGCERLNEGFLGGHWNDIHKDHCPASVNTQNPAANDT